MEELNDDSPASFSWWSGSHNRPHQSPWLQATLSDLDDKIKTMVNIIQDDGDSFAERAHAFYKRRHELLKILLDLHSSYCSLAEKYDQLRYAVRDLSNEPIISNNKESNNLKMEEDKDENLNGKSNLQTWSQMMVKGSELIEDNLRQQFELIKRNDENREVIKQLRDQVTRLMEQNRALDCCLQSYKEQEMKGSESRVSKLKSLSCIAKFNTL
ncbi:hypothetical protein JCGZ_23108 [Jatropha curcas]|uniref:NAB domain-containing protein n=1 Tax=Jatropha curcas TaxID=180498 RepID=A0A067JTG4_JATCU|nr:protein NETWORKED 3A [Jatropha curcas]XP_020540290.1 protein NETWORKED 3A [Jatropha curcas]KDP23275.1 hypothetical protein JCGZ_23108 [Jatropha curcas]